MAKPTTQISEASLQSRFFNNVYLWMSFGLFLTGITAIYIASSQTLLNFFYQSPFILFALIIGQVFLVYKLSANIDKLQVSTANNLFIGFSILNGITLSSIFLVYTGTSIALAFFMSSATFVSMTIYGYTTKSDLSELGKIMMMGLWGIIIASIINFFLNSSFVYYLISYAGVAVFTGLIAYDTQKLKQIFTQASYSNETLQKAAILGALTLYLDFINLFIFILRIVGVRNRD